MKTENRFEHFADGVDMAQALDLGVCVAGLQAALEETVIASPKKLGALVFDGWGFAPVKTTPAGMKKRLWEVTIQATITKTYRVEASDVDVAYEKAHALFSVLNDDTPEKYEQEALEACEVEP